MSEVRVLNRDHESDTDVLARIMGTKDLKRFLTLQDPDMPTAERLKLTWKMTSNQIARLRREARREIRTMHDLYLKKLELGRQLKSEKDQIYKNRIQIKHMESLLRSLNETIRSTRSVLAGLGELVNRSIEIYNFVATDHDIAQLIGANMREVEKCRKDHEESGEASNNFFTDLIFVYQAESEEGQPLFTAMYQRFVQELRRNKGLRQANYEELGSSNPALKYMPRYQVHEDALGNQVAEQVYRPLELV